MPEFPELYTNYLTRFPNWINLRTRKQAKPSNKNTPGIDYKEVAYVPPVEETNAPESVSGPETA